MVVRDFNFKLILYGMLRFDIEGITQKKHLTKEWWIYEGSNDFSLKFELKNDLSQSKNLLVLPTVSKFSLRYLKLC